MSSLSDPAHAAPTSLDRVRCDSCATEAGSEPAGARPLPPVIPMPSHLAGSLVAHGSLAYAVALEFEAGSSSQKDWLRLSSELGSASRRHLHAPVDLARLYAAAAVAAYACETKDPGSAGLCHALLEKDSTGVAV